MSNWSEAEAVDQDKEVLTTDDLVLMIGEAVIKERQTWKLVQALKQEIALLKQSLAKEQSVKATLQQRIDQLIKDNENIQMLESQVTQLKSQLQQADERINQEVNGAESLRARIAQLEEQCHQVALERDEARKTAQKKKV